MPGILTKHRRVAAKPVTKQKRAADKEWPMKISREEFLRRLRAEYTPEVCAQTLALNESLPVHGEP